MRNTPVHPLDPRLTIQRTPQTCEDKVVVLQTFVLSGLEKSGERDFGETAIVGPATEKPLVRSGFGIYVSNSLRLSPASNRRQ
jgi:hypothetical protein